MHVHLQRCSATWARIGRMLAPPHLQGATWSRWSTLRDNSRHGRGQPRQLVSTTPSHLRSACAITQRRLHLQAVTSRLQTVSTRSRRRHDSPGTEGVGRRPRRARPSHHDGGNRCDGSRDDRPDPQHRRGTSDLLVPDRRGPDPARPLRRLHRALPWLPVPDDRRPSVAVQVVGDRRSDAAQPSAPFACLTGRCSARS
jgi:hypothetical protein